MTAGVGAFNLKSLTCLDILDLKLGYWVKRAGLTLGRRLKLRLRLCLRLVRRAREKFRPLTSGLGGEVSQRSSFSFGGKSEGGCREIS